jgi:hypothetical protein
MLFRLPVGMVIFSLSKMEITEYPFYRTSFTLGHVHLSCYWGDKSLVQLLLRIGNMPFYRETINCLDVTGVGTDKFDC